MPEHEIRVRRVARLRELLLERGRRDESDLERREARLFGVSLRLGRIRLELPVGAEQRRDLGLRELASPGRRAAAAPRAGPGSCVSVASGRRSRARAGACRACSRPSSGSASAASAPRTGPRAPVAARARRVSRRRTTGRRRGCLRGRPKNLRAHDACPREAAHSHAHVTSSVGWLGAVIAFLGLAVVGITHSDAATVRAAYLVMEPAAWLVLVPLAIASLVAGIVHGLLTRWACFSTTGSCSSS